MVKVETSDESGLFQFQNIATGDYFLKATYVGLPDLIQTALKISGNSDLDLGVLTFAPQAVELQQATVTATRALVEIKPDRTVFNVQGTINSVGSNAIELLRKAPSVNIDNNDNVSVLGRSGVRIFVDGKQLPLSGDDLSNYLQSLPAEQIDRIDIITNPGARYEAEGNAGIIDIRMKKDKNLGANGSLSGTYTRGQYNRYNLNAMGNYRNKKVNIFGTAGYADNETFNDMEFRSFQNGIKLREENFSRNDREFYNFRLGTDYFINKEHTIGFLVSGRDADNIGLNNNTIDIFNNPDATIQDSTLIARNTSAAARQQQTYNLNYRFANKGGKILNIDLDYGNYDNDLSRVQPNQYVSADGENLSSNVRNFITPTNIDISTFQLDYEQNLWGGKVGTGTKLSRVLTENTFDVFNNQVSPENLDLTRSNQFDYEENVYAGYISFNRPINQKWSFSSGLRMEITDAEGDLQSFSQDSITNLEYVSWFPNVGLTWTVDPARKHVLNFAYGRRINRPDYNVLNPFKEQLSEISFSSGNPRLNPEIVNNVEVGYTLAYRFNFKLAYSQTDDQITRLISPAPEEGPNANKIFWDNLANKRVVSFNAALPFQFNDWWSAFFNVSTSFIHNIQDDPIGNEDIDLKAFSYNFFTQQTFKLPWKLTGEISGWFSGPGIWGGVFEYDESFSLNLGLQRKFLNDQLNVKVSANDIFYESGWNGVSRFNGLESFGSGNWDSRTVALSLSYNFGNQNVKSRKRKTSIEAEAGRVGN